MRNVWLVGLLVGTVVLGGLAVVQHGRQAQRTFTCHLTLPADDGGMFTEYTISNVTIPCVVEPAEGEQLNGVLGGTYVVRQTTAFLRVPPTRGGSNPRGWVSIEVKDER